MQRKSCRVLMDMESRQVSIDQDLLQKSIYFRKRLEKEVPLSSTLPS